MWASKIISNKLNELLGSNFALFPISHFNKNYTESKLVRDEDNVGYVRYNTSEYGDFRKNRVVGVVTLNNTNRSNVNYYYLTSSYDIEFSVPRNTLKTNGNGELINNSTIDFDSELEALIGQITNKKIQFTDEIYGKITMSEPTYVLTENDGEFKYDIMRVSGSFVLTDKANFGEYKVEFKIDNQYIELDDVNEFNEGTEVSANGIQLQGSMRTRQNPSTSGWSLTFSINDIQSDNQARALIKNVVHTNKEIINPTAISEKLKREVPVRITSPDGVVHSFNAIMNVSLTTKRNSIGIIVVSLTDDGE